MGAWSHSRGWLIEYREGRWVYVDTGEDAKKERACLCCHRLPTPEGYDACLGKIEGAVSACCGHGGEHATEMLLRG